MDFYRFSYKCESIYSDEENGFTQCSDLVSEKKTGYAKSYKRLFTSCVKIIALNFNYLIY